VTDLHPTPPRRRFGPGKIILVVLAGLAVFGVALFFILKGALGPLVEAGDGFMGALHDGDYVQAYARAAPDLQRRLGSAEGLRAVVVGYRPISWSWSQRSVRNGDGFLEGSATYPANNNGSAELRLRQIDGQWRVTAFELN